LAFQTLKQALVTALVLALPDFSKPFCIETDASDLGVGAVLMQDNHLNAYMSKALGPKLRVMSTYENEYLTILLAIEQWRPYLHTGEFYIASHQKSLSHLNEQRLHTPWQQKVFAKLLGLKYKIIYKKGVENRAADALSRKPVDQVTCHALSICQPNWIQQVVVSYEHDDLVQEMISKLVIDASSVPR
jgi:hypothetical protein